MGSFGNRDNRVSQYLKCWIQSPDDTVCGIYGDGTTKEIVANWTQPFEGESLESKFPTAGGLVQVGAGMTMVHTMNSRQVWQGNKPISFKLELKLYALEDPTSEVMDALRALEIMIAADIGKPAALDRVPASVCLNIGTKHIYTDLVMESISQPFDKEIDSQGRFVRCTVNIQMSSMTMITKEMYRAGYGMKA